VSIRLFVTVYSTVSLFWHGCIVGGVRIYLFGFARSIKPIEITTHINNAKRDSIIFKYFNSNISLYAIPNENSGLCTSFNR
jgi:hypothetical protein